ncbi:sialate O-acetylesterase [Verrucomicrobium sp. GAS474]|uniref:sialate O-acetylesterase n=1 Tax=Verrucomicrobium sp. GAS474 TaxID=1882831 RepID=UPI00087CC284|nr:sialate O-acetylesterase [Verrucomicrobium sp. GAS474]SDT94304.1 sialate O-acetylesterase [Verrucomicrobium sp. GAS474]
MIFLFRLLLLALLPPLAPAFAEVRMPALFGDHMVLQRGADVPVWGTAEPGEAVTVTAGAGPAAVTARATAGPDGKWIATLDRLPASEQPIDLVVAGGNTLAFHDVLVGDVWVCSGQSNMEFGITMTPVPADLAPAADPGLRLFSVPKRVSPQVEREIGPAPPNFPLLATWQVCTPETLGKTGEWGGFSAIGYYFGRELRAFTRQPVGIIGTYWGGTRIQAWTSLEMLQSLPEKAGAAKAGANFRDNYAQIKEAYETVALPEYKAALEKWTQENKAALDAYPETMRQWQAAAKEASAKGEPAPPRPIEPKPPKPPRDMAHDNSNSSALFNGMIAPLIPCAIKGVLWYQGESNSDEPLLYRVELPALIRDWRARWGGGDFPFLVVQLPNFDARPAQPADANWAVMRESQAHAAAILPSVGCVVTIDVGDARNLHPGDKADVGRRAAGLARHVAYGEPEGPYTGPVYRNANVEGSAIRIGFDKASLGAGLALANPPAPFYAAQRQAPPAVPPTVLKGFSIAGDDNRFVEASARIDGDTVVVSSDGVPVPVAVRYAWANSPECNLYNKEGYPAAPFRTDALPLPGK